MKDNPLISPSDIYEYRKRNNLNQEQLGELCGVSKAAVCNWEKGRGNPSGSSLISLRRLMSGEDGMLAVTDLEKRLLDANVKQGGFKNREDYLSQSLRVIIANGGLDKPSVELAPLCDVDSIKEVVVVDPQLEANRAGGESKLA